MFDCFDTMYINVLYIVKAFCYTVHSDIDTLYPPLGVRGWHHWPAWANIVKNIGMMGERCSQLSGKADSKQQLAISIT